MRWVRGKWYKNSSLYMDEYFCFKSDQENDFWLLRGGRYKRRVVLVL